jgi:DHA1 family multidrug resistance protein-like MFS transporter
MAANEIVSPALDSYPAMYAGSPTRRRSVKLVLYSLVVGLYWMSQYIYAASLPSYVQSKTNSLSSVGLILSMYGLWQALVRVPVGIGTDWLGWRKPFILFGLALAGLGAWLLSAADGTTGLLVGRTVTGLAAGAWVPLVVAFSSLFPPKEAIRAASFLILLQASGRIIASAANGPLNIYGGFQLSFYVAVGISAVAFLVAAAIHEPRRPSVQPSARLIGRLFLRRDILLPSVLAMLAQSITWAVSLSFVPIIAKRLGGTDNTQSVLATLAVVMLAIGSLSVTAVAKHVSSRRLVMVSFGLFFIGCTIAAFASSISTLIVSQAVLGLGLGLCYPTLMGLSIQSVIESERTIAMGLHQTWYALGMFVGPAFGGLVGQAFGIQRMFAITAVLALSLGWLGAWALARN